MQQAIDCKKCGTAFHGEAHHLICQPCHQSEVTFYQNAYHYLNRVVHQLDFKALALVTRLPELKLRTLLEALCSRTGRQDPPGHMKGRCYVCHQQTLNLPSNQNEAVCPSCLNNLVQTLQTRRMVHTQPDMAELKMVTAALASNHQPLSHGPRHLEDNTSPGWAKPLVAKAGVKHPPPGELDFLDTPEEDADWLNHIWSQTKEEAHQEALRLAHSFSSHELQHSQHALANKDGPEEPRRHFGFKK